LPIIWSKKILAKIKYDNTWEGLFQKYPTLTTREFAELANTTKVDSETILQKLTNEGKLIKSVTKNGDIWEVKNAN
jgi:putative protein-disulfide isomerase